MLADGILYTENPRDASRRPLELISELGKFTGYKIKYTEITCLSGSCLNEYTLNHSLTLFTIPFPLYRFGLLKGINIILFIFIISFFDAQAKLPITKQMFKDILFEIMNLVPLAIT